MARKDSHFAGFYMHALRSLPGLLSLGVQADPVSFCINKKGHVPGLLIDQRFFHDHLPSFTG
jgi:hypothetical protein